MKKRLTVALIITVFILALSASAYTWVPRTVTIPTFPVKVNEQEYNYNEHEQFPLFVHEGVTYFPLTYNNAMILNLLPTWDVETCSHKYVKGNPDEPKVFVEFSHSIETETRIDERTIRIDTETYQVHHFKETENKKSFDYHYEIIEETNPTTIDGKNIVSLSDYPILFYRDMVYIPLSRQFVTEVLGGTVSFDTENGLEVRVNNYFYTAYGSSSKIVTDEYVSYTVTPNYTCYIKDGLTVVLETDSQRLIGPVYKNLRIVNNGKEFIPEAYFGYFQDNIPLFSVKDGKVYTVYYTDSNELGGRDSVPCTVDIETGEITEL